MRKIQLECRQCKKSFWKPVGEYNRSNRLGRTNFFCCSRCSTEYGNSLRKDLAQDIERECLNCGKKFISTTHKKHQKCCSHQCARKYSYSHVNPRNISSGVRSYNDSIGKHRNVQQKNCPICGEIFTSKSKHCSRRCGAISRGDRTNEYLNYKRECQFNFSLSDYPNEFDFSMIETYGWYKAKNHGDNQNGISRDHIISIKWGYEHKIDPSIIRHPANCQLLRHKDNVSKGKKESISVEDLIKKINLWNEKYLQK